MEQQLGSMLCALIEEISDPDSELDPQEAQERVLKVRGRMARDKTFNLCVLG